MTNDIEVTGHEEIKPSLQKIFDYKRHLVKLTIREVEKIVCDYFNISSDELLQRTQEAEICNRRQLFQYLCVKFVNEPYHKIGNYKSCSYAHCTIVHAKKASIARIQTETKFNNDYRKICAKLLDKQNTKIIQRGGIELLIQRIKNRLDFCDTEEDIKEVLSKYYFNKQLN